MEIWWPTSNTRQHFTNVNKNKFLQIKEFGQDYAKLDRRPARLGGAQREASAKIKQAEPNPASNPSGSPMKCPRRNRLTLTSTMEKVSV